MKKHADIELGHSAYTDNANLEKKSIVKERSYKRT